MLNKMGRTFNLISLLYFTGLVAAQDANITIPLNKTLAFDDKEIYGSFITLKGMSNVNVNFSSVNKSLEFIVFQVHTHMFNITLTTYDSYKKSHATGTNVGLVSFIEDNGRFEISNYDENITVRAYISVHGYIKADPIPGGCNMELLGLPILPFLYTRTFSDYIFVETGAPAGQPGDRDCVVPMLANMTFYMMYLPELNFYADPYFSGIRNMMTLKGIEKYGTVIPYVALPATRRMLSAYPGTGAIYVVLATKTNAFNKIISYSVYVPSYSYGCTDYTEGGCEMIDDWFSQILCILLLLVGVFLCFFGHRFFKTEMFFAGFFSGVIITYILLALITDVDKPALLAASAVSGLFFGAIWWLFWWLYGIPVLAVLLPSLNLGFLLASIFYYRLPGNIVYLQWDFNFWSLFVLVMMLTALAVVPVSYAANILCCAVLGAYAAVLSIDYYMGSNYKFIIINVIRRAVVPQFNKAFLAPPGSQWRDVVVGFMWLILAALGFMFQHWHNMARPPFPPRPRAVRPSMSEPISYGSFYFLRRPMTQQDTGDGSTTPIVSRVGTERTPLLA